MKSFLNRKINEAMNYISNRFLNEVRGNLKKKKILPLPPETEIFPGHGENTNLKNEIENNPYIRE